MYVHADVCICEGVYAQLTDCCNGLMFALQCYCIAVLICHCITVLSH